MEGLFQIFQCLGGKWGGAGPDEAYLRDRVRQRGFEQDLMDRWHCAVPISLVSNEIRPELRRREPLRNNNGPSGVQGSKESS